MSLQLNTSNVILSTPGPIVPTVAGIVAADDALRPVTTFGPKKTYSESAYPILNSTPGAKVRSNPAPPASSRADARNNNLKQ